MGFVDVKGVAFYYQHQAGSPEHTNLLFIHGSGSSNEVWQNQMKTGLNSWALDLAGHGQTAGTAPTTIAQAAQSVAEFITALQLPRPLYLVGHSMGAAIAITCALNHPQLLDGIILIGAGQRMRVMPQFLDDLAQGKSDPNFIRLAFSPQTPPSVVEPMVDVFGKVPASILYADFSACNNFDASQELENISMPVLVIVGLDDKLTPLKLAEYVSSHINNSRLEVVPAAGHYVMLEAPEAVNKLILGFCSRQ